MPYGPRMRFRKMRKRTRAATKIQSLFRGFLARKKVTAKKAKVYSRYAGGRAGYKATLRNPRSYYSGVFKAKGKRSAYY